MGDSSIRWKKTTFNFLLTTFNELKGKFSQVLAFQKASGFKKASGSFSVKIRMYAHDAYNAHDGICNKIHSTNLNDS